MRLRYFFLIMHICYSVLLCANNRNSATFKIKDIKYKYILEINACIPEVLERALEKEFPALIESKSKVDYFQTLKTYIDLNFILEDINGNKMKLLSIKEFYKNGNGDLRNFIFYFQAGTINKLTNNLLLNYNREHVNKHHFEINKDIYIFNTNIRTKTYVFPIKKHLNIDTLLVYLLVLVCLIFVVLVIKKIVT